MDQLEEIPPKPEKKDYWNELLTGFFLIFVFYFISSFLTVALVKMLGWEQRFMGFQDGTYKDEESAMVFRFVQGIFMFTWFFIPMMVWAATRGKSFVVLKMNKGYDPKMILLAGITMVVSIPFISFLVITPEQFASSPELSEALKKLEAESSRLTVSLLSDASARGLSSNLFFLCLVPGIIEEVLFRGFLQRTLGKILNIHVAILITAVLFSLLHAQLLIFFPRFVLGIFLGYFFAKTGSLWVSIFAHFLYNASSVVLGYLSVNGVLPEAMLDDTFPYPMPLLLASVALTAGCFFLFMKTNKIVADE